MEILPAVPENILAKYKLRFKDVEDVSHPEIVQGLKKVMINKYEEVKLALNEGPVKINYAITNGPSSGAGPSAGRK